MFFSVPYSILTSIGLWYTFVVRVVYTNGVFLSKKIKPSFTDYRMPVMIRLRKAFCKLNLANVCLFLNITKLELKCIYVSLIVSTYVCVWNFYPQINIKCALYKYFVKVYWEIAVNWDEIALTLAFFL